MKSKLGYFDFFSCFFWNYWRKGIGLIAENLWYDPVWIMTLTSDAGLKTVAELAAHQSKSSLTVGRTDSWPVNSWLNLLTSENKLCAWSQRGFQWLTKMKSLEFQAEEICAIMLQQKSILDIVSATLLILKKISLVHLQWGLQGSYSTYWLFLNLEI